MRKITLSPSPVYSMGNFEFGQFVDSQIDSIRNTELTDDQLKALLATLQGFVSTFGTVLARIRKSNITEEITALDQMRDNSMRAFVRALMVHELSLDHAIISAVDEIEAMLKPYGNVHALKLEEETMTINRIVAQLSDSRFTAMITTLGLGSYISRMRRDNQTFWERYNERTTADMERDANDIHELRNQIIEQYSLLCRYVEVHACLETKPEFTKILSIIDTIRQKFTLKISCIGKHQLTDAEMK